MPARIPPVRRDAADPKVEAAFRRIESLGGYVPNMHLTFGRHPELYAAWLPFAVHVMPDSTLKPRHRQLLILRTSYSWRAAYPWAHHARISKVVSDLADAEIEATAADVDAGSWAPLERALLRACDETRLHGAIQAPTWQVLAAELGPRELLDVVFTIGQYALIATALNSLEVELDAGFALPDWAEGAAGPGGPRPRRA
jgi:alkylhydroperoxidase family enzyme